MLTLNIYKNQREVETTYTAEGYDLMTGTVEDILEIMEGVSDTADEAKILKTIGENKDKLFDLLMDVFPGVTKEELRRTKLKEMIPFFIALFGYVQASFGEAGN